MKLSNVMPAFQLSVRGALSAVLAMGFAQMLNLQFPLYAMIGAVLVTDLSPAQTRELGVQRFWGTLLGAAIGAGFSRFVPHGLLSIGISIGSAMFITHLLGLKGAARVAGYLCGLIVFEFRDEPLSYAAYRLLETAIGIGMALIVSHVPKLADFDKPKPSDP